MDDEALTATLEEAGLSPYQAEAYVTLLDLGTASATEVAEACDVPDPRIYDVLRDLEAMEYVETFTQDALTARARDPADVLADLESRSERFLEAAEAIEDRWSRPAVGDHEVTVLSRFETVFDRARESIASATVQVSACLSTEQFHDLRDELAAATDRGVVVRLSIWTEDPTADLAEAQAFEGACTEVRHRPTPGPFLVVADRERTCYLPYRRPEEGYGLVIDDRMHTNVFRWFFSLCLWDGCPVVHTERTGEAPRSYVDLPSAVLAIEALREDGATVEVEVIGVDPDTTADRRLSGTVTDVEHGGAASGTDRVAVLELSMPMQLYVQTDEGETVVVGGWGAVLEDVEAHRVTITDVSYE